MVQGNTQAIILGVLFVISQFLIQYWLPTVILARTKRKVILAALHKQITMDEAEKLLELLSPGKAHEDTAPAKPPATRPWWKRWPP